MRNQREYEEADLGGLLGSVAKHSRCIPREPKRRFRKRYKLLASHEYGRW